MARHRIATSVALFLFAGTFVFAQVTDLTTASIFGRALDESGGVLAGVTVEARSSSLQGVRAGTTDSKGFYRLTLLPPGAYDVTFTLAGFATEVKKAIPVRLGKDATLDVVMRPAAKETLVVSAEAPVVDTTSNTLGTTLPQRAIETLPTGRNYSSIVQVTPGTSSDADYRNSQQNTITVYGSSGAENAFYIDGVNTTGVEYGFQGKNLNYEFVQEVEVKTAGYAAEYGRSTGGIINVITKSGGNEFHGDAFGYFDSQSLQASAKAVVSTGGTTQGFTREDFGADLGGFILKDRLWFFGAYDRVHNTIKSSVTCDQCDPPRVITGETKSNSNLGAAKLTFSIAPSHSLVATFIQDPRVDTGAINDSDHSLNGDPLTYEGRLDFGGRNYSGRYEGIFGADWVVSLQGARHEERNSVGPATAAGDTIQYQDAANNFFQTGGFGLIQKKNFTRDFFGGSLTRYLKGHEVKFGAEYEKEDATVIKRESGGQLVTAFPNAVEPSRPVYEHFYWTTPTATVADAPLSQLNATPAHKNLTLYLQDKWAIFPNLTVNAGVRWDHQKIIDANGVEQINLKRDFAPRAGIIWDPGRDHKTKVFASYGRFYEEIPMDLVIRSFSFERQPRIINFDLVDNHPDPAAEADHGTASAILGGFTEPSDPNIHGQYISEYVVGGEREIAPNIAVGIKGVYRDYGNVIEDFLCTSDGSYCIGNPGKGGPGQSASGFFPGFTRDFTLGFLNTPPDLTTFPTPRAVRIYRGVQLDVTKRFSDNWSAIASYIYSKLEGNYDGEYAPFTQTTLNDPNISAAYDYYDFFTDGRNLNVITNRGPLSNDRRHQLKVSGLYVTPFRLAVGLVAYYRTGTPFTRYGFSDAYGRYEFFLTHRGAEGRMPSNYEADLHLGYPIAIGPVDVNVLVDVFSILNTQRAIVLDERWGFVEADNASPTPVNPNYGKPILRTSPTTARVGVRVSF